MSVTYDSTILICGHTPDTSCTGCMILSVSLRNTDRKCSHSFSDFMDAASDLMTALIARTRFTDSASLEVVIMSASWNTFTAESDNRSAPMFGTSSERMLVTVLLVPGLRSELPSRVIPEL